ncbi:hypothetical protein Anas_00456 [Armadillidium nasatum]|uniref:Secreted protein n=1 Tax=Armadillidium nasatum TaxID=96803 RepID=A0A5N5TP15_9CRUS|nr:hypothetical protein Anas_00456 [Armadillidium nasatum]
MCLIVLSFLYDPISALFCRRYVSIRGHSVKCMAHSDINDLLATKSTSISHNMCELSDRKISHFIFPPQKRK